MMYYHVSDKNNLKTLSPRVPSNYLVENGFENSKDKRISMSTSISGALAGMSCNLKDKILYVYIPDNYSGRIKQTKDLKELVPDSQLTDEVWLLSDVKLKLIYTIEVKNTLYSSIYTFGDNEQAALWFWDYKVIDDYSGVQPVASNITESISIINKLNHEYDILCKTMDISESLGGLMLLIIPKLITLILAIVNKIFYLLTVPVVLALLNNTKNIRITGKKLFRKEATLHSIGKSIDLNSVKAAASSLKAGDGASVIKAINKILENAANESKEEYMSRIDKGDYKEAIDQALDKYMSTVTSEMSNAKPSLRGTISFNNPKQLKEMIVDEAVFGPHLMHLFCIPISKEDLGYLRREVRRYTLDDMDKAISIIDHHISNLETLDSVDLAGHIRSTMDNPDKVFEEFYNTMFAKMKRMHMKLGMFDPHLFKDNYIARGNNEISNNLKENDEGDFLKQIFPMNLSEILKIVDFKDLGTSVMDVFEYFAAANTMPDKDLNKRRDDITNQFKEFEERIRKADGHKYDGGFPEKYVKASLEFIRTDLLNRFHTIVTARMYIHEIVDGSEDIITEILSLFGDTIMAFIVDDVEHHPTQYNTTPEKLHNII